MSCIVWYILAIVAFPTILMLADAYIGYKKGGSELMGISVFAEQSYYNFNSWHSRLSSQKRELKRRREGRSD